MESLGHANPFFIRCIRSNNEKVRSRFFFIDRYVSGLAFSLWGLVLLLAMLSGSLVGPDRALSGCSKQRRGGSSWF